MSESGGVMRKQPEVREKTRTELVTAFWKLYKHKSIDKITISELTSTAGYHRGTFYEYFQDIYDLLEQEENALMTQLPEMFAKIYDPKDAPNPVHIISQFYLKNGEHLNILINQGNTDFLNRFKDTMYPIFLKILKLEHTPELRLIAEYGISGILMTLHKWYEDGCQIPIENFIKLVFSLNFHGFFNTLWALQEDTLKDVEVKAPEKLATIINNIDLNSSAN